MSESELPKITLKGGAGYEAPWITVPFGDVEAAKSHLLAIQNSGLLEAVAQTAELFRGVVSAGPILQQAPPEQPSQPAAQPAWGTIAPQGFQPAQQGQQWNQQPQQAPPQQQGGPEFHPEGLQCQTCGGRVQKKNLTRKSDGKAFSLWTCPNQRSKGDGHFSEFAN